MPLKPGGEGSKRKGSRNRKWRSCKKKRKKKKALGQVRSVDKPRKKEIQQENVVKALGQKAMGPSAGDVGTSISDKGKRNMNASSKHSKEGISPAESKAGGGIGNSHKRKVSECEKGPLVLESKEEESSDDKRKKAKQRSIGKQKKVTSVDMKKESCDLAEDSRQSASNGLGMDDSVVAKLERQFDMLADEGLTQAGECLSPVVLASKGLSPKNTGSKKRKRVSSSASTPQGNGVLVQPGGNSNDGTPMTGSKHANNSSGGKVKRVRFALKKNLVWTPSTPLPAQSVRVPPSATPRGSALKKGVPPGPIVSTTANALKQRKGTPLRPSTYGKTSQNKKSVLKRVKLLGKKRMSI
eukprot:c24086_g4_i1 orf=589-1650(-)